ncbi:CGNR zinc finger domain-containing protein [Clostridium oryzae]|uniref:CGNR zinc finger domain-containing protein n=1 Tax=Clostridium oryzae TaxID=1450648 RepID=UPI001A9A66EF|nr:CGNR zinc finger domain-containing protein [Clostridium oryzae]
MSSGIRKIETSCKHINSRDFNIELSFFSIKKDLNYIIAEIAASFANLLIYHDISRLKKCKNPDCNWFFHDETKSRTKIWCDNNCANLMKVRKFRRRKKAESNE